MSSDNDEEFIKELLEKTIDELEVDSSNIDEQLPMVITPIISHPLNRSLDINDDYSFSRATIRAQLQLMDAASKHALLGIMESRHPKSIEAFATLMGQVTNAAEKLMKLQTDTTRASNINPNSSPNPLLNNSTPVCDVYEDFSGSSSDLLDEVGDNLNPIVIIDNGPKETSS
jgi:hypothetical protein